MPTNSSLKPALTAEPGLRLLLVEDTPADAELTLRALRHAGLEVSADLVCTEEEFVRLLHDHDYDIILADHNLPTWNGLEALKSLRELGKETPFILVTGSLGEERAVECLKAGASDYVLKDRIVRLPFAVKRALAEHHAHSER
ncbi:MAG: response regulator, partial [Candidatus Acidiferrales bacterium]